MESLASLFYLLAFIFFIKAAGAGSTARRGAFYCLVGVSYLFGFYSKEIAYTLPALILLFDLFFTSNGRITGLLRRWPLYIALAILFAFFTVKTVIPIGGFSDLSKDSEAASVQKVEKKKLIPGTEIPIQRDITAGFSMPMYTPKEYLFTQFNVTLYYMTVLIFPANQNLDYDFPIAYDFFSTPEVREGTALNIPIPPPAVSFAVLLAIAASAAVVAVRSFKSGAITGRIASFFVFWYFIILSPTSSFIPIADVVFEHRVYLPSLGFFVIFVTCVDGLFTKLFCRDIGTEKGGQGGQGGS
jgi:hypothetical protein